MKSLNVTPFDASEYLDDAETVASYVRSAIESGDPEELRQALADIAKAQATRPLVTPKNQVTSDADRRAAIQAILDEHRDVIKALAKR